MRSVGVDIVGERPPYIAACALCCGAARGRAPIPRQPRPPLRYRSGSGRGRRRRRRRHRRLGRSGRGRCSRPLQLRLPPQLPADRRAIAPSARPTRGQMSAEGGSYGSSTSRGAACPRARPPHRGARRAQHSAATFLGAANPAASTTSSAPSPPARRLARVERRDVEGVEPEPVGAAEGEHVAAERAERARAARAWVAGRAAPTVSSQRHSRARRAAPRVAYAAALGRRGGGLFGHLTLNLC